MMSLRLSRLNIVSLGLIVASINAGCVPLATEVPVASPTRAESISSLPSPTPEIHHSDQACNTLLMATLNASRRQGCRSVWQRWARLPETSMQSE